MSITPGAARADIEKKISAEIARLAREGPSADECCAPETASNLCWIWRQRLRRNIRQKKGIAYFAASQLWHYPALGLWVSFSPAQTDSTGAAITEFQKERRSLAGEHPITAQELEQAKSSVIRSLPQQYEMLWTATEHIARNWAWGMPVSHLQTFPEQIAAVTLADDRRSILRPDRRSRKDRAATWQSRSRPTCRSRVTG